MEQVDVWTQSLVAATTTLWTKIANFAPNLVGALLMLAVGYLIARIVSVVVKKLLSTLGIDRFSENAGISSVLDQANIHTAISAIIGRIVFWILMLTFLVSSTETLGLPRVSGTIDSLVQYLPKVLGSVFILLVGLFVAGFVRDVVRTAASGIGFEYARTLGTMAYSVLVVLVISLAVGQLELETAMLTQAISIVLLSAGAAAAIAFGLGSKDVAANVLAGSYVRDSFREGESIDIGGGTKGAVKAVGAVNTTLETADGEISVPNVTLISSVAFKTKSNPTP